MNIGDAFNRSSSLCLDGRVKLQKSHAVAGGGFADVWEGTLGRQRVAIKVIRQFSGTGELIQEPKLLRRIWREYLAWSRHSHPNILQCLGFSYDFSPESYSIPSLISPWMENGTITMFLRNQPRTDRLKLTVGVAKGLSFLHDNGIVHGDLRGGNILVSADGNPCLSDFGLARLNELGGMTTSGGVTGSLRWMAPELFKPESSVTEASDIWAFGMTVMEIVSGERPYATLKSDVVVFGCVINGGLPHPMGMSGRLWSICERCWAFDPFARPSISTLLNTADGLQSRELKLLGTLTSSDSTVPKSMTHTRSTESSQYMMGKAIGSGTYSIVNQAVHVQTGRLYACKLINKKLVGGREQIARNEIAVLKRVSKGHPNIVVFHKSFETAETLYIYMELCTGGYFFDTMSSKARFDECDVAALIRTIMSAVKYLHQEGIVHGDINPKNLLLRSTAEGAEVVIAGFGFSRVLVKEERLEYPAEMCGTPGYMAPEIVRKSGYGKPADIWAIGVIIYRLLCGCAPPEDGIYGISHPYYAPEPEKHWVVISKAARDFVLGCLAADPSARGTAAQALQHSWLLHVALPDVENRFGDPPKDLRPNLRKLFGGHNRPWNCCICYGTMEKCVDSKRKERKKGVEHGPYKRRDNKGLATDAARDDDNARALSSNMPFVVPVSYLAGMWSSYSPGGPGNRIEGSGYTQPLFALTPIVGQVLHGADSHNAAAAAGGEGISHFPVGFYPAMFISYPGPYPPYPMSATHPDFHYAYPPPLGVNPLSPPNIVANNANGEPGASASAELRNKDMPDSGVAADEETSDPMVTATEPQVNARITPTEAHVNGVVDKDKK